MVSMTRMNRLLELDFPNRCATVQPGLINLWLSQATREHGYYFAPDPSSQMVSSIGGNASTNAGGPHCLKYGITVNHVLGLELVTGAGEILRVGGKAQDPPGYDLTGALVGGEGTLGLLTAITVRLLHVPAGVKTLLASFAAIDDASEAVSAIVGAGIIPAALEMIDETFVRAINEGVGAGYPKGAGAVLLDRAGWPRGGDRGPGRTHRADLPRSRRPRDPGGQGRCGAGPPLEGTQGGGGRGGSHVAHVDSQDAVVPRSRLPEIMREVQAIGARHRLVIANVFHAGDGNLHPMILYNDHIPGDLERAHEANDELLRACLAMGAA